MRATQAQGRRDTAPGMVDALIVGFWFQHRSSQALQQADLQLRQGAANLRGVFPVTHISSFSIVRIKQEGQKQLMQE